MWFSLSGASGICLNILSNLHSSVHLSDRERDDAQQYSRPHTVQSQKQVIIKKKYEKIVRNREKYRRIVTLGRGQWKTGVSRGNREGWQVCYRAAWISE